MEFNCVIRMSSTFPWKGNNRHIVMDRNWNVSDRARTKWIKWLDRASDAIICCNHQKRTVELKMNSIVDGVPYCAGFYIHINDFDDLLNQLQSD